MTSPHMSPDEFRTVGHELIEWVAAYMERVETLPVVAPVAPGDVRAQLPAAAPEQGEQWDGDRGRPRPDRRPGHDPLAAPGLVRVLPRQRERPEHPRRARQRRPRHAGDAVVDGPGLHGARDARARLARRPARSAAGVPVGLHRRRRDPALGVGRGAVRDRRGARAGGRRSGLAGGVLLDPDALLGREGSARRRHPAPPLDRGRRRVRDAAGRARAADRGRPRRRADAVLLLRHARHDVVARVRPGGRDRRGLPRRRRLAPRRRGDGGRRRHLPGAPVAERRPRARRQLRHERRTSGCTRTSTATCSGCATARR